MRIRTIIAATAAPLALAGIALTATAATASTAVPTAAQQSAAHNWTAVSVLHNRADVGASNNPWAYDNFTRTLTIRPTGSSGTGASTIYYYSASYKDNGTFKTVNGALTPNQSGPYAGQTENGSVTGTMTGFEQYSFTATSLPNMKLVPASPAPGTGSTDAWYKLAFPAGTTFGGSGLGNWGWHYNGPVVVTLDSTGKHVIAIHHERWNETYSNNGGQLAQDGNINGIGL
jgi:hypothetical protein